MASVCLWGKVMKNNQCYVLLRLFLALIAGLLITGCVATEPDKAELTKLKGSKKKLKKKAKTEVKYHKALRKKAKHKYFVEFRSRPNGIASHSFIAYGRLYSRGRIRRVKLIGLHPKNGSAGFLIGSVVGMEAQLAPVWGDKFVPHTVSFRVPLTWKQYKKMVKFIKQEKAKKHTWNLILNNCNGFVARVAELVGLEAPVATASSPSSYVKSLAEMNS